MRTPMRLLAALLITVVIVGCGSGDDAMTDEVVETSGGSPVPSMDSDDAADDAVSEPQREAGDGEAEGQAGAADDGEVRPISEGAPTGRKVIRTAELVLESSDTAETLGRIRGVAERAGGYTATTDLQRDDDGVVRGTLTLRVPSDTLSDVVEDLEELGETVPVNRIDERDVSTEHADMQARIENLTAYESELRTLLADVRETTTEPEDLLRVFERIRSVREEIDLIEGRLAALSDQISYATVTVTLRPTSDDGAGLEEASPWAPGETFSEALAATGRLLTALVDGLIWFVVTGIPVLVSFLGLPALAIYLLIRWIQRRPSSDDGSPPPPEHPGEPEAAPSTPQA